MRRKRGFIQIAILHLLKEDAMNGYQLMKELESRSDNTYTASSGTIYPALNELVQKEWITVEDEEKKTYRLTPLGVETVTNSKHETSSDFWQEWKNHMIWKKSDDAQVIKQAMDELTDTLKPLLKHGHEHPEKIKKLTTLIQQFTETIRKEV